MSAQGGGQGQVAGFKQRALTQAVAVHEKPKDNGGILSH